MKQIMLIVILIFSVSISLNEVSASETVNIVTTITDYAYFAKEIGKEKVSVRSICQGDENAHYVRPKPSFINICQSANLFIGTGLDLELWVPDLLEKSANKNIQSGQKGYIAAADGIKMMDIPTVLSRSEGGLHVYGNPHVTVGPLNTLNIIDNILIGLKKVSPENASFFEKNHNELKSKIIEALYGKELTEIIEPQTLIELTYNGKLIDFLNDNKLKGRPIIEKLGGWMKKAMPLRGKKIVTYHRSWIYFTSIFGIEAAAEIEPKPGIPPTPKHTLEVIDVIKKENIKLILTENFYDLQKVNFIAEKASIKPVIVPVYVNGEPGVDSYFKLVDTWLDRMLEAVK